MHSASRGRNFSALPVSNKVNGGVLCYQEWLPVHDPKTLVIQAQSNDLGAFEELVNLYQNKVYGLCLHLTGNPDDAQDPGPGAFIRAYKALGRFRNEADFGTWITGLR